jgi:protein SCO1/2
VPPFRFVDQRGHAVTDADLRGHAWLFDFMYASCTSLCPTLSAKLAMLERKLPEPALRFVSFSVDPAHDTPQILAEYAARFRPGAQRWLLLATDETGLERFASGVGADLSESGDPSDPVRHSATFFLVDRDGLLAGSYDSSDPSALARLRADAAKLTQAGSPRADETAEALRASLGCDGCHARAELAPPLACLGGQTVELAGGRRVVRDEAYLRESLLEPSAKLVRGYPSRMPGYGAELSTRELDALVVSLMNLPPSCTSARAVIAAPNPTSALLRPPAGHERADAGSAAVAPEIASDPVCGMDVHVGPKTPHANFEGHRYVFCSDACRERFEQTPQKFARGARVTP